MPEIDTPFTTFTHQDAEVNGILISYWPTVMPYTCDVCGEAVQNYVRLTKGFYDSKVVRCCDGCAKSVIKRWSKES